MKLINLIRPNKSREVQLREHLAKIEHIQVADGIHWVAIPEADLRILCGCPADSVKHLMKKGLIVLKKKGDVQYETGPNAILLSDVLIQRGSFGNLAEFPVLQMLPAGHDPPWTPQ